MQNYALPIVNELILLYYAGVAFQYYIEDEHNQLGNDQQAEVALRLKELVLKYKPQGYGVEVVECAEHDNDVPNK